jgi:hypothetical protein
MPLHHPILDAALLFIGIYILWHHRHFGNGFRNLFRRHQGQLDGFSAPHGYDPQYGYSSQF